MFFFFSKVLTIFFFPLPAIIIFGLVAVWKIRGLRNKFLSIFPILSLWAFSSFPVCQYLITSLEDEFPPRTIDSVGTSDAIVVLGGMINNLTKYPERVELTGSVERLTDSAELWRQKKAKTILISGGSGVLFFQGNPEASLAKKFLVQIGVDEKSILTEEKSKNTAENALYSAEILQTRNVKKIILVTSAFHMRRSIALFEKRGFEIEPFPTDYRSLIPVFSWESIVPSVGALDTSTIAIKEWIGIYAYKLQGFTD